MFVHILTLPMLDGNHHAVIFVRCDAIEQSLRGFRLTYHDLVLRTGAAAARSTV